MAALNRAEAAIVKNVAEMITADINKFENELMAKYPILNPSSGYTKTTIDGRHYVVDYWEGKNRLRNFEGYDRGSFEAILEWHKKSVVE